MASITAFSSPTTTTLHRLHTPSLSPLRRPTTTTHHHRLHFSPLPAPPPLRLHLGRTRPLIAASSLNPTPPSDPTPSDPTIIASIVSVARLVLKTLIGIPYRIASPSPDDSFAINSLLLSAGPLFFAYAGPGRGYVLPKDSGAIANADAPIRIVAKGLAKWLNIYSNLLMIRIMLSWFPNIPWDKQPLCAMRDICDPYLNLFRVVIPPIWNTIDVSPFLAFAVMGAVSGVLTGK
ncbi:YlmG homolog protein 1-2, chloroplastic-like protein [Drosera capensis]